MLHSEISFFLKKPQTPTALELSSPRLCSCAAPVWRKWTSSDIKQTWTENLKYRKKKEMEKHHQFYFRAIFYHLGFKFHQGASPDQSSWISPFPDICVAKQASHISFLKSPSWASLTPQPQASENVRTSRKKPWDKECPFGQGSVAWFVPARSHQKCWSVPGRLWDVKWLPELLLPRENIICECWGGRGELHL